MEKEQTKKCKYCQENISIKASRCPKCGGDLRGWIFRHPILTFLLILITSPFWGAFLFGIFSASSSGQKEVNGSPEPERKEVFNANVRFDGDRFIVSNLEASDCQNAKLEVNGKYVMDGYKLEAGQIYTIGAAEFSDSSSNRFNPLSQKAKSILLFCRGENELRYSSFYGELK
jgi:hypothetical protein